MRTPSLENVLACPKLPSLPAVAVEVIELTGNADVKLRDIANVIQNDQALTTRILKTVNSSYYGLQKPCPTISRALTYLGLSTVKSLVLGFSLVDIAKQRGEGFDYAAYWKRCLFSATAARRLAEQTHACDPEEAFIAALMQDVGMLALNVAWGQQYVDLVREVGDDHRRLPIREREVLGFDHADVGEQLAARWRLPGGLVAAIARHHDADAPADPALLRHVVLSGEIAMALSLNNPHAATSRASRHAAEWLRLEPTALRSVLAEIDGDVNELSRLFRVQVGEAPEINRILAEAEDAALRHQLEIQQEAESLRRSNSELARQATTDGLTGVANRQQFEETLREQFMHAAECRGSLGLLMVDADRFKQLNDTYGHQAGDTVLVGLARRISASIRGMDLVCRYGGEEFAVIVPGATLEGVVRIGERVRCAVDAEPIEVDESSSDDTSIPVTVSVGASVFEPSTAHLLSTHELLLRTADKALYAAKQSGRNCVRVFRPSTPESATPSAA